MQLTKTQTEILKAVTAEISKRFSILQISKKTKKQYPLTHRSVKQLIERRVLLKDEYGLLYPNHKEHTSVFSYIESLRKEDFLEKNRTIALFAMDALNGMALDFFVLLIFGSSAAGRQNPRDIDVLLIIPEKKDVAVAEAALDRIASNFSVKIDSNVISVESVREMLSKRGEHNIMNETLDNHIIIFGAENYYRLLKNA